MNSVPKLFSCCYADCWTENHFSTEFGVLTPNHTHSHTLFWGCVSRWFGRALAWHARGHRFDPGNLHQKEKHRTEMCGAFLLLPNEWGFSSAGRAPCMDCKRVTVIRIGPVISTRKKKHRTEMCGAFCFTPSGSALRRPLGRAGFAKQRRRGRGR